MSKLKQLLDDGNYATWKQDVINLLRAKTLLMYVDETAQPTPSTATTKDVKKSSIAQNRQLTATVGGKANWVGQCKDDNTMSKNKSSQGRGLGYEKELDSENSQNVRAHWSDDSKGHNKADKVYHLCCERGHYVNGRNAPKPIPKAGWGTPQGGGLQVRGHQYNAIHEDDIIEIMEAVFTMFIMDDKSTTEEAGLQNPVRLMVTKYNGENDRPCECGHTIIEELNTAKDIILGGLEAKGALFSLDSSSAFLIMDSGTSPHFYNDKTMLRELVLNSKVETTSHKSNLAVNGYKSVDLNIRMYKLDLSNVYVNLHVIVNFKLTNPTNQAAHTKWKMGKPQQVMNDHREIINNKLTCNFYTIDLKMVTFNFKVLFNAKEKVQNTRTSTNSKNIAPKYASNIKGKPVNERRKESSNKNRNQMNWNKPTTLDTGRLL